MLQALAGWCSHIIVNGSYIDFSARRWASQKDFPFTTACAETFTGSGDCASRNVVVEPEGHRKFPTGYNLRSKPEADNKADLIRLPVEREDGQGFGHVTNRGWVARGPRFNLATLGRQDRRTAQVERNTAGTEPKREIRLSPDHPDVGQCAGGGDL